MAPSFSARCLLAQRCRDVCISMTVVRLALAAGDQDFGRAFFGGIGVEALALAVALGLAKLVGGRLAVRRAVGTCRTRGSPRYHGAGLGQPRQRIARSLYGIAG